MRDENNAETFPSATSEWGHNLEKYIWQIGQFQEIYLANWTMLRDIFGNFQKYILQFKKVIQQFAFSILNK